MFVVLLLKAAEDSQSGKTNNCEQGIEPSLKDHQFLGPSPELPYLVPCSEAR